MSKRVAAGEQVARGDGGDPLRVEIVSIVDESLGHSFCVGTPLVTR